MTDEEIRAVVEHTLVSQRDTMVANQDAVVMKTIATILTSFGIDEDDHKSFREDISFLHRLRVGTEQIHSTAWKAIVTTAVSTVALLLWYGIKMVLNARGVE